MVARTRHTRSLVTSLRQLKPKQLQNTSLGHYHGVQAFHTTSSPQTDGVFRGLLDTRLPMPWIEAFRLQQQKKATDQPSGPKKERDLTPKKMSDSYHRVVLPLGQDPWLSDTYINSSGQIRYILT